MVRHLADTASSIMTEPISSQECLLHCLGSWLLSCAEASSDLLTRAMFSSMWSSHLEADSKCGYYVWSNSFLLHEWKLLSQVKGTGACGIVDPGSPVLRGEWVRASLLCWRPRAAVRRSMKVSAILFHFQDVDVLSSFILQPHACPFVFFKILLSIFTF